MQNLHDTIILKTISFLITMTIIIVIIHFMSRIINCSPSTGRLDAGEEDGRLEVHRDLDVGEVGQAQQLVDDVGVVLRLLHVRHREDNLGVVGSVSIYLI